MNTRKDKKLLEGVRNTLFLSAGMVLQQLENLQSMEDELKEARTSSDKLQQEKTEISTALGVEKAMVVSLEKEKSLAIQEKTSALQAKELALAAQKKSEEDKAKLAEEPQQAIETADKAETQNLELQAKLQRLEVELQVFMIFGSTEGFLFGIFISIVLCIEIGFLFFRLLKIRRFRKSKPNAQRSMINPSLVSRE